MKKILKEFKDFIARGNVLDMAIGVIIAGAFGKITTSLVNDVLMPFIGWVTGSRDMTGLNIIVREGIANAEGGWAVEPITIGFGTLVGTIVDFLLVAMVVFAIVKATNAAKAKAEAKKKAEEAAAPPPAPPAPSKEELLLTEIRDLLKNK